MAGYLECLNRLDMVNSLMAIVIQEIIINTLFIGDFYVNNGRKQPGCTAHRHRFTKWFGKFIEFSMFKCVICTDDQMLSIVHYFYGIQDKCSHDRAHHLFWESLTTKFMAIRCSSFLDIERKVCLCDKTVAMMGGDISRDSPKPQGIFYLETTGESPFVISDHHIFNQTTILCLRDIPQITAEPSSALHSESELEPYE